MMSPSCSELDSTGNSFGEGIRDVPPDLVVSAQSSAWFHTDKSGRRGRRRSEKSKPSRQIDSRIGRHGAEILNPVSSKESEKLQKRLHTPGEIYDTSLEAAKNRNNQSFIPCKVEAYREEAGDMRYVANPHALLNDNPEKLWGLSHVEKWVREQEFLLHRPKDIEPFTSEPVYDAEYHRKSSVQSSSLDGSGSFPRLYTRQKPPKYIYENPNFAGDMKAPLLSQVDMQPGYYPTNRERVKENDINSNNNAPKRRVPPPYEDSIRATKGSKVTDSPSYYRKSEPPRIPRTDLINNGYHDRREVPSAQPPSNFSLLKTTRDATESHSWDRKYASQRYLDKSLRGIDEYVSAANIPDVAREATQSTQLFAKPPRNDIENGRSSSFVNGEVVLRRNRNESFNRRLEDRKFKAQSWPKFTVTSGVMPTAKKVKVTPVGSHSSGIPQDDVDAIDGTTERKNIPECKKILAPEEAQYLQKYVLNDEVSASPVDSSLKVDTSGGRQATSFSPTSDVKGTVPSITTQDATLPSCSDIGVRNELKITSNGSVMEPESDSPRDYQNNNTRQLTHRLPSSYRPALSTGDSTLKAASAPEKRTSEFRQSAGYKRASGGLKDLIRLHEHEIAKASRNDSVKKETIPSKPRKDSVGHRHTSIGIGVREKSEQSVDGKWKRHTTIGLVNVNDLNNENLTFVESIFDSNYRPTLSTACPSTETGFDSMTDRRGRYHTEGAIREGDHRPPPLPPKPKYTKPRSLHHENTKDTLEVVPRARSRSRPTEEEALQELEKVTRTLESFKTLAIERAEKGCQTDGRVYFEDEVLALTADLKQSVHSQQEKIEQDTLERLELERKLNEQRKVANAYQKLEDRYRRRVHELQRVLMTCSCGAGYTLNKNKHNYSINNTFPRHGKNSTRPQSESEDKAAAKVDGILQELETWLNTQQGSKTNSSSEELSAIHLQAKSVESLRGSLSDVRMTRENPPFEILDEIDATCV